MWVSAQQEVIDLIRVQKPLMAQIKSKLGQSFRDVIKSTMVTVVLQVHLNQLPLTVINSNINSIGGFHHAAVLNLLPK